MMGGALALLGLGAAAAVYAAPSFAKVVAIRRLAARAAARRALVLTYDDGPGPELTTALRAVLAEHGARATFFVSGERAARFPDSVRALLADGHEVGSHGLHHVHAWRAAPWRVARDVGAGIEGLARLQAGRSAQQPLFRPPYGKLNLAGAYAARRRGARLGWWTHDSGDSYAVLPESLPGRSALLQQGGVVLLHDLDRSAPRNAYVLHVTRQLLEAAPSAGLQVLTLGELLDPQNENRTPK